MAENNPVSALLLIIITIFSKLPRNTSSPTLLRFPRPVPFLGIAVSKANLNYLVVPPLGVFMIAGCGADLLINILLTFLGYVPPLLDHNILTESCSYFPGHIHAFYLIYVYFERHDRSRLGNMGADRAPGIYSDNVQSGGRTNYGTVAT